MPAAFVPGPHDDVPPDEGVERGIAWMLSHDGPCCVLVPAMRNYDSTPLRKRVSQDRVATLQSKSRSLLDRPGVAVLGCWPADKELEALHRKALAGEPVCVLRWTNSIEERAWINSTQAVNLVSGQVGDDRHRVGLDPVVQAALETLSRSVNLSAWHPADEKRVKWVLLNAPRQGHAYDPDRLFEWVLEQHLFPWRQATTLRELASRVHKGGTFQLRGSQPFRDDIWDVWRADTEASTASREGTPEGSAQSA